MPAASVLWPRHGVSRVLQSLPRTPLQCVASSPQDLWEWRPSRRPAHPRSATCLPQDAWDRLSSRRSACKCLRPSRCSGCARVAHPTVAYQACARLRLRVFAGAPWPCAWPLPCAGSAPRRCPLRLQIRAGSNQSQQERSPAALPLLRPGPRQHGQAASSLQGAAWHRVARAPLLHQASNCVRGCWVAAALGVKIEKKRFWGVTVILLMAPPFGHCKYLFQLLSHLHQTLYTTSNTLY